mgnify:CR=1 FL=1
MNNKELANLIETSGNTMIVNLYAVLNKKTGLIIKHKNKSYYATRRSAREARLQLLEKRFLSKNIKIVQTQFVNVGTWKNAI